MLHSGSVSWLAMRSLPVSSEHTACPAQLDGTLGDHALKPGQHKAARSQRKHNCKRLMEPEFLSRQENKIAPVLSVVATDCNKTRSDGNYFDEVGLQCCLNNPTMTDDSTLSRAPAPLPPPQTPIFLDRLPKSHNSILYITYLESLNGTTNLLSCGWVITDQLRW